MKNETIKTITEITPLDGLKLLVKSEGKPVEGLEFMDSAYRRKGWQSHKLEWIIPGSGLPFHCKSHCFDTCAKVTEIDPCQSPEGCPELEPWMAYVGMGPISGSPEHQGSLFFCSKTLQSWTHSTGATNDNLHYCVDVRTAWAQSELNEHCRIRAYVEPKPIDDTARLEWVMQQLKGKSFTFAPGLGCLGKLDRNSIDWAMKGAAS